MSTRFRLNLERLDEKITPSGISSLSVVAPDSSQLTGTFDVPHTGIDPTLANQYVPLTTLEVDWKGAHYSGYGGQPTNFVNQPQAHFQNGVFQGVKFDLRPPGSPGGPTLQPPNSASPWTTVSVLDAVATFDDPNLPAVADPKRTVTTTAAPQITCDFASITQGQAYKILVDVTFTDDSKIDTIEIDVFVSTTRTSMRNQVANALNSLTTVNAIKDGDTELTVQGKGDKQLKALSIRSKVDGYQGPSFEGKAGTVQYDNSKLP